ncbi:MAG: DUF169 domain-containing protein [Acidobacteria bacterium]|nr:DUF169 domain-containing protein [Acidobacteriota bacterium]
MDAKTKALFIRKWEKYFPGSEWPLACFYSDSLCGAEPAPMPRPSDKGYTCVFGQLAAVRAGKPLAFNGENLGCFGAIGTLGFSANAPTREEAAYLVDFLVTTEKFYRSAAQVEATMKHNPPLPARGRYLVVKRWDALEKADRPQVVCFFATPDTVSGLHALAGYDSMTPHAVMAPFSSGCDTLIGFAMKELDSAEPRAVLGGFDPSMRSCTKPSVLTFSVPWPKFLTMLDNMDRCFLTTTVWDVIRRRMQRT